jgi:hypothetical protein
MKNKVEIHTIYNNLLTIDSIVEEWNCETKINDRRVKGLPVPFELSYKISNPLLISARGPAAYILHRPEDTSHFAVYRSKSRQYPVNVVLQMLSKFERIA